MGMIRRCATLETRRDEKGIHGIHFFVVCYEEGGSIVCVSVSRVEGGVVCSLLSKREKEKNVLLMMRLQSRDRLVTARLGSFRAAIDCAKVCVQQQVQ